jgi:hypothetical protein
VRSAPSWRGPSDRAGGGLAPLSRRSGRSSFSLPSTAAGLLRQNASPFPERSLGSSWRRPCGTTARFGGTFLGRPYDRSRGAPGSSSGQLDHLTRPRKGGRTRQQENSRVCRRAVRRTANRGRVQGIVGSHPKPGEPHSFSASPPGCLNRWVAAPKRQRGGVLLSRTAPRETWTGEVGPYGPTANLHERRTPYAAARQTAWAARQPAVGSPRGAFQPTRNRQASCWAVRPYGPPSRAKRPGTQPWRTGTLLPCDPITTVATYPDPRHPAGQACSNQPSQERNPRAAEFYTVLPYPHVASIHRCVGPQHARDLGLRAEVEGTGARNAKRRIALGVLARSVQDPARPLVRLPSHGKSQHPPGMPAAAHGDEPVKRYEQADRLREQGCHLMRGSCSNSWVCADWKEVRLQVPLFGQKVARSARGTNPPPRATLPSGARKFY